MLINDINQHIIQYRTHIKNAFSRTLNQGWLVLGPEVKKFEKSFADYLGVAHCVTLANGTDALELALRAVGVLQNSKVATVANAGFYTSTATLAIGAKPVYLDVDLETHGVSLDEIKRAISEGIQAIVVTHLYGCAIKNIVEITQLCKAANVALIEDCAQAHGAMVNGQKVGSFGDMACFSFYPTKNLGALGDGGAVVSNRSDLAEKVAQLRQYGWSSKYHVQLAHARNSRLDELQAAVLSEFLPYLDTWNERRCQIAALYSQQIKHEQIKVPLIAEKGTSVAHLYVIRSPKRNQLREHLQKLGISTDVHYPVPDYRQAVFENRLADLHLPNTEQLAKEILTLPCYPEMSNEQVQEVIQGVNTWQA